MIFENLKSDKVRPISAALRALQNKREVETAVLCTNDGLTVIGQAPEQIAAVASFLVASAQQGSAILGRKSEVQEVIVSMENGSTLICLPFTAQEVSLILAVIFSKEIAYRRLLSQTVNAIQQAISDN